MNSILESFVDALRPKLDGGFIGFVLKNITNYYEEHHAVQPITFNRVLLSQFVRSTVFKTGYLSLLLLGILIFMLLPCFFVLCPMLLNKTRFKSKDDEVYKTPKTKKHVTVTAHISVFTILSIVFLFVSLYSLQATTSRLFEKVQLTELSPSEHLQICDRLIDKVVEFVDEIGRDVFEMATDVMEKFNLEFGMKNVYSLLNDVHVVMDAQENVKQFNSKSRRDFLEMSTRVDMISSEIHDTLAQMCDSTVHSAQCKKLTNASKHFHVNIDLSKVELEVASLLATLLKELVSMPRKKIQKLMAKLKKKEKEFRNLPNHYKEKVEIKKKRLLHMLTIICDSFFVKIVNIRSMIYNLKKQDPFSDSMGFGKLLILFAFLSGFILLIFLFLSMVSSALLVKPSSVTSRPVAYVLRQNRVTKEHRKTLNRVFKLCTIIFLGMFTFLITVLLLIGGIQKTEVCRYLTHRKAIAINDESINKLMHLVYHFTMSEMYRNATEEKEKVFELDIFNNTVFMEHTGDLANKSAPIPLNIVLPKNLIYNLVDNNHTHHSIFRKSKIFPEGLDGICNKNCRPKLTHFAMNVVRMKLFNKANKIASKKNIKAMFNRSDAADHIAHNIKRVLPYVHKTLINPNYNGSVDELSKPLFLSNMTLTEYIDQLNTFIASLTKEGKVSAVAIKFLKRYVKQLGKYSGSATSIEENIAYLLKAFQGLRNVAMQSADDNIIAKLKKLIPYLDKIAENVRNADTMMNTVHYILDISLREKLSKKLDSKYPVYLAKIEAIFPDYTKVQKTFETTREAFCDSFVSGWFFFIGCFGFCLILCKIGMMFFKHHDIDEALELAHNRHHKIP